MILGTLSFDLCAAQGSVGNTADDELFLYPQPRNLTIGSGFYELSDGCIFCDNMASRAVQKICSAAQNLANVTLLPVSDGESGSEIVLYKDDSLNEQGYTIIISQDGITIRYKDDEGAYYAATTLYQIFWQKQSRLPYLTIENDYPDFKYRAFDMDISRNRIPTVETLKSVADMLESLKYNQFFLYLEGYSYGYESYKEAWDDAVPLTSEEIREVSEYCRERGIDLIPAQNSLGHSQKVVNTYPELGDTSTGQVLNVFDDNTYTYLSNIYDDLYDDFQTELLQIGGDETAFDLANGTAAKSWQQLNPGEEVSAEKIYIDSMKKLYDLAESKGKRVMFWSDMIVKYDLYDLAKELMPNAIAMNWCYYAGERGLTRFDYTSKGLSNADIPFYVCAGDQSWATIVGDTATLCENAENAAIKGKEYSAIGYCMTNWGDGGHYQNLPSSYPGISYGGGLSWCYDKNTKDINSYDKYLDIFVYQDTTNTVSEAFSAIANYKADYSIPYEVYVPKVMMNDSWDNFKSSSYLWKLMDSDGDSSVSIEERDKLIRNCDEISARIEDFLGTLEKSDLNGKDKELLKTELKNTAMTLKVTVDYIAMRSKLMTGGEIEEAYASVYDIREDIINGAREFSQVIKDFKQLWGKRDLVNNLNSTIYQFRNVSTFYNKFAGVRDAYPADNDGNLFILTPETAELPAAAASGINGTSVWLSTGAYVPILTINRIGAKTTQRLKEVFESEALSVKDGIFSYDTEALINGGIL